MRKLLFPVFAGLFSIIFMGSCESEMPSSSSVSVEEAERVNVWVYQTMRDNYLYWTNRDSADFNYTLQPAEFFAGIKSNSDTFTSFAKISDITSKTTYDIGFEYAINNYRGDGVTYYVVLYTKPGTLAHSNMKRGDNIIAVNGTEVTEQNAETLLSNAIQEGNNVSLSYMRPPQSLPVDVDFPVLASSDDPIANENPIYTVTDTVMGSIKVGYLAYNKFSSDFNTQLQTALTGLSGKGINYFVLDLRYNPGGDLSPIGVLGSALVENRVANEPFMIYDRREGIANLQIPISDNASIPKLGDQLNKIYIITGQYTASASEAFINALRAYRPSDVVLVGEKTAAGANNNIATVSGRDEKNQWLLSNIPIGYMADKDGNSSYTNGFTPASKYLVNDVNPDEIEAMLPLGVTSERIYKAIIDDIRGVRSLKSINQSTDSYRMPSSIMSKSWANTAIADVE